MAAYGPYTSKDLDYFGYREAAQKLADVLGGTLYIPTGDDHTPQTAIVKARISDQDVEIDFLHHIKGVEPDSLEKSAVEILLTVRAGERTGDLRVPIMHPLHCMQSRLANVVSLGRKTDLAKRQLEASPIVLAEFLAQRLDLGGQKHVIGVFQSLTNYLLRDPIGRKAHLTMKNDPASILDRFQEDGRLDERWRHLSLAPLRQKIASRRTAWGAMKARVAEALGRTADL